MPTPVSAELRLQDLGIEMTAEEIARLKAWLEFGDEDVERLAELNEFAGRYADDVIEDVYEHFLGHDETRMFFEDPAVLEYVKRMQRAYFLRLTQGDYDEAYVSERLTIGAVHEQIGLDVKWYLGAYNRYLRAVGRRIFEAFPDDPQRALDRFFSLKKLVFLDIGLAIDTYVSQRERERTIREQQEAIRELSTPVLQAGDVALVATAVSEMARNILNYAREGEIVLRVVREHAGRTAVVVIARDDGPGIADIKRAMQDGFTTSRGLGLGLPGAKRLMDDFEISSQVGAGTTVTMRKRARAA